jgi:hypothetical protein
MLMSNLLTSFNLFKLNSFNFKRNFYEFFYSHLPIIECQIFQLRSNIIDILPSLFNQLARSLNGFRRLNVKQQQQHRDDYSSTVRINKEVNTFCLKFESLCNSPRLSKPAWLTIVQNRNDVNKKQQQQQTC